MASNCAEKGRPCLREELGLGSGYSSRVRLSVPSVGRSNTCGGCIDRTGEGGLKRAAEEQIRGGQGSPVCTCHCLSRRGDSGCMH